MFVDVKVLQFPVIAFSPAGWMKESDDIQELTFAGPDDDLSEWQRLVIYDSAGLKYSAQRVYRAWPASRLGGWMCRLFSVAIYTDMDLETPCAASLDELKDRIIAVYGELEELRNAISHRVLITKCL